MKWIFVLVTGLLAMIPAAHSATVPAVGCATDGQAGPEPPPPNTTRPVDIDETTAAGLAWYFQSSTGVLAPRGWYCVALSGSNGTSLYVTPRQLSAGKMLGLGFKGIQGPAIQVSVAVGDTSGRFIAAKRMARLFPHVRKFVDAVIAENFEPASAFPAGPYPGDTLSRRGLNVVEYLTPAGASGLGTDSWLVPGDLPIKGVVILLDADHSVLTLAVRLPQAGGNAGDVIVRQVETDNPPMPVAGAQAVDTAVPGLAPGTYAAVTESDWHLELKLERDGSAIYTISSWEPGKVSATTERKTVRGRWSRDGNRVAVRFSGADAAKSVVYELVECLSYQYFGSKGCSFGLKPVTNTMPDSYSQPVWNVSAFKPPDAG